MTLPNLITLLRLLLIPAFAWMAIRYGQSVDAGFPEESLRWSAVAIYATASLLDGLDGWIARRFNQKSLMGAIMDPLVDKALLMTGLVMATFVNWGVDWHLPLWFIVLVIARDLEIIVGIWILYFINRRVPIEPHWVGKVCTVTQMIAMGWIMLKVTNINPIYPTLLAAFFTIWSAYEYYMMGYRQLPKNQPKA
ncbi:MAG: CDP-alcohol phosphatidyltransferase family protein [Akkermansiaceae bacterium]